MPFPGQQTNTTRLAISNERQLGGNYNFRFQGKLTSLTQKKLKFKSGNYTIVFINIYQKILTMISCVYGALSQSYIN